MSHPRRLVVLESFPTPRPTTNPYIVMLLRSLQTADGLDVRTFSWREALLHRHDVVHLHWPEILVTGASALKSRLRQVLVVLLLLRWRLDRTAVVRTVHNPWPPSDLDRVQRLLLRAIERCTVHRIRLQESTAVDGPSTVIPHGHYRDWYTAPADVPAVPGRLGFVGLVRRYKGVEALLDAFRALPDDDLSLAVAGRPSTDSLAAQLRAQAAGDPRIELDLRYLDDDAFVRRVREAELVVLPYQEMHNSASLLTALSLDRAVLVPDNASNRAVAAEVGPGWVHRFTGAIGPDAIRAAVRARREQPPAAPPDLSGRGWQDTARAHAEVYRAAVGARRQRVRRPVRPYSA